MSKKIFFLYSEKAQLHDVNNNGGDIVDLISSYDAAWTKRGRQHNSLSGKLWNLIK